MPPRRPKDRGTDAERAVARWLAANGWPHAERRAPSGSADRGDITGTPGICWEVKSRKTPPGDKQITDWLEETEQERLNAGADIGVLVVRRPGVGPQHAGRWWAYLTALGLFDVYAGMLDEGRVAVWAMTWAAYTGDIPVRLHLADVVTMLRKGGWGDPIEDDPEVTQ